MNKQIFWIASYPKSGNTLLRSIISSIFFTNDGLFNFKLLKNIPIIESTINLEFIKKNHPRDYINKHNLEVLSKYWQAIQSRENLGFNSDFLFVKTHHALSKVFNHSFTSDSCTRGIIYVVRDPRDVVLSYAHHFNSSIEKSIMDTAPGGIVAGYPLINRTAKLISADYNELESSPIAYAIAASNAFKMACKESMPDMLEPLMSLEVVVPT